MTDQLPLFGDSTAHEPPVLDAVAHLTLGTQGFAYADWVGPLYAAGTAPRDFLARYARIFHAVEIDSTFYGTPRAEVVDAWREKTPADFTFAAKFPRTITHDAQLVGDDARTDAHTFVETMQRLGAKGGPLVLQFPHAFGPHKLADLDAFLPALPRGPRYVVEVRNRAWADAAAYADLLATLRRHSVALALIDHPWMERLTDLTADFAYIRLIGDRRAVTTFDRTILDRTQDIEWWASAIREFLRRAVQTYVFANNHFAGHSPATLRLLHARITEKAAAPESDGRPPAR